MPACLTQLPSVIGAQRLAATWVVFALLGVLASNILRTGSAARKVSPNDWCASRDRAIARTIDARFVAVLFCMLNLTPTALKTRLSRARLQLREHLSRYFKKPN
jgi:hypothetical protein